MRNWYIFLVIYTFYEVRFGVILAKLIVVFLFQY